MGRFDEIIPLVRQGSVSLFIGAGFSLKAGAPKVDSLKRALIRTLPSGYKIGRWMVEFGRMEKLEELGIV